MGSPTKQRETDSWKTKQNKAKLLHSVSGIPFYYGTDYTTLNKMKRVESEVMSNLMKKGKCGCKIGGERLGAFRAVSLLNICVKDKTKNVEGHQMKTALQMFMNMRAFMSHQLWTFTHISHTVSFHTHNMWWCVFWGCIKMIVWDWRDGLMTKSSDCSCSSDPSLWGLLHSLTLMFTYTVTRKTECCSLPCSVDSHTCLSSLLASVGTVHMLYIHTGKQNIHALISF